VNFLIARKMAEEKIKNEQEQEAEATENTASEQDKATEKDKK
jgi:hypothetical protein